MQIELQENWKPAKKGRLNRVGTKKKRGAVDILEKSESPISQEMENSHWLKGNKTGITLTMANHDCCIEHYIKASLITGK